MDRDLGFHLFYGIFILAESFETRSANHCYHWPCMEISCLNRTLCTNGICSEPLVCLPRAAEGSKDKQWWEPDSSTVNSEVAFPGKLSTSQSPGAWNPGENRWDWCNRKTLLLFSNSLPGSFPLPGIATLAYGGREQRKRSGVWGHRGLGYILALFLEIVTLANLKHLHPKSLFPICKIGIKVF